MLGTSANELEAFFDESELKPETYDHYADLAFSTSRARERFGELLTQYVDQVESGQGSALRLAVGYLIIGEYESALRWFEKADDDKYRHYYAGHAARSAGKLDAALSAFKNAATRGWDAFEIDMLAAEVLLQQNDPDAASALIEKHNQDGADRAPWYYARALLAEDRSEREEAVELYEKALTLDPDHEQAMFRCAWLYDLHGEDDKSIELYRDLARRPRAHVNALINLAVVYEDQGEFDEAGLCLQRVLYADPNHSRARLFQKDVESSMEMLIDDAVERRVEKRNRMLQRQITEFELSVRARNCLKKMKIQTLGDLLNLSETELLSYKNFGETSLQEIKALLQKLGLHLGQKPEDIDETVLAEPVPAPKVAVPAGSEAVLSKPVSELELSVRARRCLQRLNIGTLGELIQHSEPELLSTRNFGATSLTEIKTRLNDFGLKLSTK